MDNLQQVNWVYLFEASYLHTFILVIEVYTELYRKHYRSRPVKPLRRWNKGQKWHCARLPRYVTSHAAWMQLCQYLKNFYTRFRNVSPEKLLKILDWANSCHPISNIHCWNWIIFTPVSEDQCTQLWIGCLFAFFPNRALLSTVFTRSLICGHVSHLGKLQPCLFL